MRVAIDPFFQLTGQNSKQSIKKKYIFLVELKCEFSILCQNEKSSICLRKYCFSFLAWDFLNLK